MCTTALPGSFRSVEISAWGIVSDQFVYNVDFSLSKSFRVSEGKSLQIDAQAFNVFNMQILGTPVRMSLRRHSEPCQHAAAIAVRRKDLSGTLGSRFFVVRRF